MKRVYDPPAKKDGKRFLVDRLWPRGIKKEALKLEAWLKEAAPSDSLRRWFGHDPKKWDEFQKRYAKELDAKPGLWKLLLATARKGDLTLLFAAKDEERNNAVVLKGYLERK